MCHLRSNFKKGLLGLALRKEFSIFPPTINFFRVCPAAENNTGWIYTLSGKPASSDWVRNSIKTWPLDHEIKLMAGTLSIPPFPSWLRFWSTWITIRLVLLHTASSLFFTQILSPNEYWHLKLHNSVGFQRTHWIFPLNTLASIMGKTVL